MVRPNRRHGGRSSTPAFHYRQHTILDASMPQGLEDVAERELLQRFGTHARVLRSSPGTILFEYHGEIAALLALRTLTSIYLVLSFEVARPRALLGDQNRRRLLETIQSVRQLWPPSAYTSMHLSAAGAGSPTMRRLLEEIAMETGLHVSQEEADLHLRVRPALRGGGWDVLIRLSPRPISARAWRVCDMPGALNACVAAAMVLLSEPPAGPAFLNPACGSGTILIERAASGGTARLIGCDTSTVAVDCARENIAAARCEPSIEIHDWDARRMPLDDGSVDAICSDLPFGHVVGTHDANRELYPDILAECARVARPGAVCCLLTHQAGLVDELVGRDEAWVLERKTRVHLSGLIPTLFVLRRARL